jgi:integrase
VQTLVASDYETRFSTPKTERGRRTVALDPATMRVLAEHRDRQQIERAMWGDAYTDHDLVLAREDGAPLHPHGFSQAFRRHVKLAGLPTIRLHDLRHTYATLALQAGLHPKVVQERLGHSSIAITMDTYSHAIPALQESAAAMVASLVLDPAHVAG